MIIFPFTLLNYLYSIWFYLFLSIFPSGSSPFNHLLGIMSNTSCTITVLINTKKIVNAVYRLIFLNVEFILGKKDEKIPVIEAINKS